MTSVTRVGLRRTCRPRGDPKPPGSPSSGLAAFAARGISPLTVFLEPRGRGEMVKTQIKGDRASFFLFLKLTRGSWRLAQACRFRAKEPVEGMRLQV